MRERNLQGKFSENSQKSKDVFCVGKNKHRILSAQLPLIIHVPISPVTLLFHYGTTLLVLKFNSSGFEFFLKKNSNPLELNFRTN